MHKKSFSVYKFFKNLILMINNKANETGAPYKVFGLFGLLNYPLSHFMWHEVLPQKYSPLSLRIIAALLCVPLILEKYWPNKLRPYLGLYWYATLLYSLPFFATFMLLKNEFSSDWLMNNLLGLFLFMVLVDWFSFIMLLGLGIVIGICCYWLTGGNIGYIFDKDTIELYVYMYFFVVIIGLIFSRNKEVNANEKLQAMQSLAVTIAHELRTPLRTISSSAIGIKKYFPSLFQGYKLAKDNNLSVPYIDPGHLKSIPVACDTVQSEVDASFTFIDMLLVKFKKHAISQEQLQICNINVCIEEALRRYPFNANERELIRWDGSYNFNFKGDKLLIIHLLFNLLKNGIYYVRAANKGAIFIWAERSRKYNILHFKDTGKGINANILPHIFNRFFTKTMHGTGVGLAYCKMIMEVLGGRIECDSREGKYTDFTLYFPAFDKSAKLNNWKDGNSGE